MEREQFGVRSFRGARGARGLPIGIFSDTGFGVREPGVHIFGNAPGFIDPSMWHTFFDDFDNFTVADWVITTVEAGAGSATEALGNEDGGTLVITNDAADDDSDFFQKVGESFRFEAGKPMIFGARLKVSDATQSDFVVGLQILDTTPLDVTDGIFFRKDDGDALLDFAVEKDNTATQALGIATAVNNTYLTPQFFYDGGSLIHYGVNGVILGSLAITNAPNDEDLTVSFGIQNGEAVAKIMTVDYIMAAKYRG